MKTKNFLKHLMVGAVMLTACKVVGQSSVPGHVAAGPTDFLGWDNTMPNNNFPLMVRHDLNQSIHFFTDNRFRMLLNPSVTYGLLGGFSLIPADGFALITPNDLFLQSGPKGPFSRLHLAEGNGDNTQALGYRPWQRNGITFTGNGDHGYIGPKYKEEDVTDMVIQWSDNPGENRPDKMRFIFTSEYDGSVSGAQSEEGLEGMRLWPVDFREMNVGVGDFYADGTDPTERLHVLNGRVRIEELPNDAPAEGLTKVLVVDDAALPSNERGVVKWMDITDLVPADCEWTMSTGAQNNVSTAFGPADPDCPDDTDAVGIGVDLLGVAQPAKLNVEVVASQMNTGLDILVNGPNSFQAGATIDVTGNGQSVRGVQTQTYGNCNVAISGEFISHDVANYVTAVEGLAHNGYGYVIGVHGETRTTASENFGVKGEVAGGSGVHYGVHGTAPVQTNSWAVYSAGSQFSTTLGTWTISDPQFKTNIQEFGNALPLIMQLDPVSYSYNIEAYPTLNLETGSQVGLLAPNVQEVFPSLVRDVHRPAEVDSFGVMVASALDFKAVNYEGLIPILIGALQEQNSSLEELRSRVGTLEEQLQQCCIDRTQDEGKDALNPSWSEESLSTQGAQLRIQPNPFNQHTTVFYTVARTGRMQLLANSADGKELRVLDEAQREMGDYQYEWNTAGIAPGIYYVTLLLDGQPVVKKAVKVDR